MTIEVLNEDGSVAGHLRIDAQGRLSMIDGSASLREFQDFYQAGLSIDRSVVQGNVAYNLSGAVLLPTDPDFKDLLDGFLEEEGFVAGALT